MVVLLAALMLAVPYPKLGSYSMARGDGTPYLVNVGGSPRAWPLDSAAVASQAKRHEVVLDLSPFTEYRPDVLREMKRLNPSLHLYAYVTTWTWTNPNPAMGDTLLNFPWKLWCAVRDTRGQLWNTDGSVHRTLWNVNLAHRDACGRYDTAEAMADTVGTVLSRSPAPWDGVFVDAPALDILWTSVPGDALDAERNGYPDLGSFASGWREGCAVYGWRLRRWLGRDRALIGNQDRESLPVYNGTMRENFPLLGERSWLGNMRGEWRDDSTLWTPRLSWLTLPWTKSPAVDLRRQRFVMASAALSDAVGALTGSPWDDARGFADLWPDEAAVSVRTRVASDTLRYRGWLGAPKGPAYEWRGLWRRDFTTGSVFVNAGTTIVRDSLERRFYHIKGTAANRALNSPNDGSSLTVITLGPQDGIMLLSASSRTVQP